MRTYQVLKDLSEVLEATGEQDDDSLYKGCWKKCPELTNAIEDDLRRIGGGCPRVRSLGFKIRDPDRQGAHTCRAEVFYDGWDDFEVVLTMLIHQGIIWLRVRKRPQNAQFDKIANLLDKGDAAHLRDYEFSNA